MEGMFIFPQKIDIGIKGLISEKKIFGKFWGITYICIL
jgi:hypothetical protein